MLKINELNKTTAAACLSVAHLFFQRKSTKGFRVDGRLSGAGWSIVIVAVSVAIAAVTGLTLSATVH